MSFSKATNPRRTCSAPAVTFTDVEVLGFTFDFDGPVSTNTVVLSRDLAPEVHGIRCSTNFLTSSGQTNGNLIDFRITGEAKCTAPGVVFRCQASGSDRWTRN